MGTAKIPNRLTGGQKPHIAQLLANFDAVTDFLMQVPNGSNVGTLDQNNFNDSLVNSRLGLNSAVVSARRHQEQGQRLLQGLDDDPGLFPGRESYFTVTVPTNGLLKMRAHGYSQIFSGSNFFVANIMLDHATVTNNPFFKSESTFPKDWVVGQGLAAGPVYSWADPSPGTAAQFQTLNRGGWACLAPTAGVHTIGISVSKTINAVVHGYFEVTQMEVIVESYS